MSKDYDSNTILLVNQLFKDLFSIKPAFKMAFETHEDLQNCKRQWMSAFKEADITTIESLQNAMRKVRLHPSPFFPSPGEFIALCNPTPEYFGAPCIDDAYKQACRNAYPDGTEKKWSHPAVKYAYEKTVPFALRTESKAKTFPIFKRNYEDALKQYSEGRIMQQIENKKTPEEYQEYVGRMKSDIALGIKASATVILSFDEWLGSN